MTQAAQEAAFDVPNWIYGEGGYTSIMKDPSGADFTNLGIALSAEVPENPDNFPEPPVKVGLEFFMYMKKSHLASSESVMAYASITEWIEQKEYSVACVMNNVSGANNVYNFHGQSNLSSGAADWTTTAFKSVAGYRPNQENFVDPWAIVDPYATGEEKFDVQIDESELVMLKEQLESCKTLPADDPACKDAKDYYQYMKGYEYDNKLCQPSADPDCKACPTDGSNPMCVPTTTTGGRRRMQQSGDTYDYIPEPPRDKKECDWLFPVTAYPNEHAACQTDIDNINARCPKRGLMPPNSCIVSEWMRSSTCNVPSSKAMTNGWCDPDQLSKLLTLPPRDQTECDFFFDSTDTANHSQCKTDVAAIWQSCRWEDQFCWFNAWMNSKTCTDGKGDFCISGMMIGGEHVLLMPKEALCIPPNVGASMEGQCATDYDAIANQCTGKNVICNRYAWKASQTCTPSTGFNPEPFCPQDKVFRPPQQAALCDTAFDSTQTDAIAQCSKDWTAVDGACKSAANVDKCKLDNWLNSATCRRERAKFCWIKDMGDDGSSTSGGAKADPPTVADACGFFFDATSQPEAFSQCSTDVGAVANQCASTPDDLQCYADAFMNTDTCKKYAAEFCAKPKLLDNYGAPFFQTGPFYADVSDTDYSYFSCRAEIVESARVVDMLMSDWDVAPGNKYKTIVTLGARSLTADGKQAQQLMEEKVAFEVQVPTFQTFVRDDANVVKDFQDAFGTADPVEAKLVTLAKARQPTFTWIDEPNKIGIDTAFALEVAYLVPESATDTNKVAVRMTTTTPNPMDPNPNGTIASKLSGTNWAHMRVFNLTSDGWPHTQIAEQSIDCIIDVDAKTATVNTYAGQTFRAGYSAQAAADPANARPSSDPEWKTLDLNKPEERAYYEPYKNNATDQYDWPCVAIFDKVDPENYFVNVTAGSVIKFTQDIDIEVAQKPAYVEFYYNATKPQAVKVDFQEAGSFSYNSTVDAADHSKIATQNVSWGYRVPADINAPNNMLVMFSLGTDNFYTNADTVTQTVTVQNKADFGGEYFTIACETVHNEGQDFPKGYKVTNWVHTDFIFDPTTAKRIDDPRDAPNGVFFKKFTENLELMKTRQAPGSTAAEQKCVAMMTFPKFDDGSGTFKAEEFFGEYEMFFGVAKSGVTANSANAKKGLPLAAGVEPAITERYSYTLNLFPPTVDESIRDEITKFESIQIEKFFETSYEFDAVKSFLTGAPSAEWTAKGFTSGQAYANSGLVKLIGETVVVPGDLEATKMRLTMQGHVPEMLTKTWTNVSGQDTFKDADGTILNHWFILENTDWFDMPKKVVTCTFVIGKPEQHIVKEWEPDFDPSLAASPQDSPKMRPAAEQDFRDVWEADHLYTSRLVDTKPAGATKVFVSSCATEISLAGMEPKDIEVVFDSFYKVTMGINYFESATAATSVEVAKGQTEAYLPLPFYDEEAAELEKANKYEPFYNYMYKLPAAQGKGFFNIDLTWQVNEKFDQPDMLKLNFTADVPTTWMQGVKAMDQFVQLTKKRQPTPTPQHLVVMCGTSDTASAGYYWETTDNLYQLLKQGGITFNSWGSQTGATTKAGVWENKPSSTSSASPRWATTNTVFQCFMEYAVPKKNRDKSFFEAMEIKHGYLVSGGTGNAAWEATEGKIPEPVVEVAKLTYQDYNHIYFDSAFKDLDNTALSTIANSLGSNIGSWKEQKFAYAGFDVSMLMTDRFADDALRFKWFTDMPQEVLPKGAILYNYVQLEDYYNPGGFITVGCRSTIGTAGSQKVENFEGGKKFDLAQAASKTVDKQNEEEQKKTNGAFGPIFIDAQAEAWNYETQAWDAMVHQPCVADMRLKKDEDNSQIFSTWGLTIGARVYKSITDSNPVQLFEFDHVIEFYPPSDDDYQDNTILEDFEVVDFDTIDPAEFATYSDEEIEAMEAAATADVAGLAKSEVEKVITAASNIGITFPANSKSKQSVTSAYKQFDKIDQPDDLEFNFEADLPRAALSEGNIVVQWLTLTNKADGAKQFGVVCKVSVDNIDGVETMVFNSASIGSAAGAASKEWWNVGTAALHPDLWSRRGPGAKTYELATSKADKQNNQLQKCKAIVEVYKNVDAASDPLPEGTYEAKTGVWIYASEDGTSFDDVSPSSVAFDFVIKRPKIKTKPVSKAIVDKVEFNPDVAAAAAKDYTAATSVNTALGVPTDKDVKFNLNVDYKAVKDLKVPDMMFVDFTVSGPEALAKDGDKIFSYMSYAKKADVANLGTKWVTVGCVATVGNPAAAEVITWEDTQKFDSASQTGKSIDDLKAYASKKDRTFTHFYSKWFDEKNYAKTVDATTGIATQVCRAVWFQPLKYGTNWAAYWAEYSVETGSRIFNDANTATTSVTIDEKSFDYTLAKPIYEFGDDYEFSDKPSELDTFTEYAKFAMSDFITGAPGQGFVKLAGGFRFIPNFETLMWQLTFSLDMPSQFFNDNNWLYFWATYIQTVPTPPADVKLAGVSCALQMNNMKSAVVKEYNENFDGAQTNVKISELNSANEDYINGFKRNYKLKNYSLETFGARKTQKCTAMFPMDTQDALAQKDVKFQATLGGRVYANADATTADATLTDQTFTFTMPSFASETKNGRTCIKVTKKNTVCMENLEDVEATTEIMFTSSKDFDSQSLWNVAGSGKQSVTLGYQTIPHVPAASDKLGIAFDLDIPAAAVEMGSSVYQWVTYKKQGDANAVPTTVGCYSVRGDPFVSQVLTYQTNKPLTDTATDVAKKTVLRQAASYAAKKKASFGLTQDISWYSEEESFKDATANVLQPCLATFDLGKKIEAGDDFLGTYEYESGFRIYTDERATDFKSAGTNEATGVFAAPTKDLAAKFEIKDPPADKFFQFNVLEVASKFLAKDYFKINTGKSGFTLADDMWVYQVITGGYKVYDASVGANRWYFNMALEYPDGLLKTGEIVYQWLNYKDLTAGSTLAGANSCKVEVGDYSKTSSSEWTTNVALNSAQKYVQNVKWHQQAPDNKTKDPQFKAYPWDESIYAEKASTRPQETLAGGAVTYKIQQCQVEVVMENPEKIANRRYILETGSRFYENNDAKVFDSGLEAVHEWYYPIVNHDPAMNVPATYDANTIQAEAVTPKEVEVDTATLFATEIAANTVAQNNANGGNMEILTASGKQANNGKQSYAQGYTTYEGLTEDDFWWWWLALDVQDLAINANDIIYQYVTIGKDVLGKDAAGATTTVKQYETVGCYVTKGEANLPSAIDVYGPGSNAWQLNNKDAQQPTPQDNPDVVGKKYNEQAAALKQSAHDVKWVAGKQHIAASNLPADSTTAGNTKYGCYFVYPYKKLGRNPNDFGIQIDLQYSARVYAGTAATTFVQLPVQSETITKAAIPAYKSAPAASAGGAGATTPAGDFAMVAWVGALVALLMTMF